MGLFSNVNIFTKYPLWRLYTKCLLVSFLMALSERGVFEESTTWFFFIIKKKSVLFSVPQYSLTSEIRVKNL